MNKPLQTSSRLGVVDALPWFCLTGNCIITQFGTLQHLLYPQFSARMVTNYRQGSVGYTVFLIRREMLMPLSHCYSDSVFTFNITMQKKGE